MNTEHQILSFIREITIVVIGILVALFINNWNESIKHQKFLSKTLFAIAEEIKDSKEDIESILDKHSWTIDSLEASYSNESESIREVFTKIEGFQIPQIKNIGLRFFITYNAELVDYELISDLSEIEFLYKGFEIKVDRLMKEGYGFIENTEITHKKQLVNLISEIVESEEQLIERYEEFLAVHQKTLELGKN